MSILEPTLLTLGLGGIAVYWLYRKFEQNAVEEKYRGHSMVMFGDSITAGGGSDAQGFFGMYPPQGDLIGKALNINFRNLATGGETIDVAFTGSPVLHEGKEIPLKYKDIIDEIQRCNEDVVYIRYHMSKHSAEDYCTKLNFIVDECLNRGKLPILVGATEVAELGWGYENAKLADECMRKIAQEKYLPFIDVRNGVSRPIKYTFDGIHPTKEYSDLQVDYISEQIKQILG